MVYKYAAKLGEENSAVAAGRSLSISTKQSVEICRFLRKKKLQRAKNMLNDVIAHKIAVPYIRYYGDVGHKKGKIAAGRYPEKASKEILKILESVEANAQLKGLSTGDLFIEHICAHLASRPWHYGRQRRRKTKRTHIEVIVTEKKNKKQEKKIEEKKPEVKEETTEKQNIVSKKPEISKAIEEKKQVVEEKEEVKEQPTEKKEEKKETKVKKND
ncbi:50S ribosomal protein L22 [Candidatus Woesearchaeota archaeon]|nr:50S ribosomal protein L22 [Candidatus Woesearchaeota archaeon]